MDGGKFVMAFKDTKDMDFDYFDLYLYYDESSPSSLRWKVDVSDKIKADSVAGSISFHSYWKVVLHGKNWAGHRIVYLLNHKSILTNMTIDHLNGDRLNNNINNLKSKTFSDNMRNVKKHRDGSASGIFGVRLHTNKQGRQYAFATWHDENGKQREGIYYRVDKFPPGIALQLAMEQRQNEISRLVSIGHDYTERHGK